MCLAGEAREDFSAFSIQSDPVNLTAKDHKVCDPLIVYPRLWPWIFVISREHSSIVSFICTNQNDSWISVKSLLLNLQTFWNSSDKQLPLNIS
jgi:hypothetical protein